MLWTPATSEPFLRGNRHLTGVTTKGAALVARGQHGYVALLEGRKAAPGCAQGHVLLP